MAIRQNFFKEVVFMWWKRLLAQLKALKDRLTRKVSKPSDVTDDMDSLLLETEDAVENAWDSIVTAKHNICQILCNSAM